MTPDQRDAMRVIFKDIADKHGMTEADLYVRDRCYAVSRARWAAWAECRARGYSFPVIAALGGWDHTTIIHGVREHQKVAA